MTYFRTGKKLDPALQERTSELHDTIMRLMEHELDGRTTVDNIVNAINRGVAKDQVLELQSLYAGKNYILGIGELFPNEIADAIRDYEPRKAERQVLEPQPPSNA
jgi:hypothetical protein